MHARIPVAALKMALTYRKTHKLIVLPTSTDDPYSVWYWESTI